MSAQNNNGDDKDLSSIIYVCEGIINCALVRTKELAIKSALNRLGSSMGEPNFKILPEFTKHCCGIYRRNIATQKPTPYMSVCVCVCFSCDIQLLNGQLVLIAVLQPLNDCCCLFWLCSCSPGHKLIALFSRSFIDKRLTWNWKLLNQYNDLGMNWPISIR